MTHPHFGPILRSLSRARPAATDAELLGRFAAGRDGDAFAALVGRHGRLVWSVCRHLAGPDAEDAFQATFLVLLRNAGRVRHPDSLPAWLHGVACRVSAKARRAAARRAARERAAAAAEATAAVVPESAWDRALAAVHEEVARLPKAVRAPFVLCALEGRTVTEAAAYLGCGVSTLSARLGRAKDTLLRRMQARGLTAGAVVALAVTAEAVPRAAARAAVTAAGGGAVPGNVQILTKGVVGMTMHQFKLVAAGVLVALGLGVGGGAGWLATADAQGPPRSEPALTAEERVRQLEAQLERAKREVEEQKAAERRRALGELAQLATARWQYALVPVKDVDAGGFGQLLREREASGWDYAGQATVKKEAVWVFRRPTGGPSGTSAGQSGGGSFNRWSGGAVNPLEPGHGTYPRPPVNNTPPDATDPKASEKKK